MRLDITCIKHNPTFDVSISYGMAYLTEWTYKSLIKPIAPSNNLANITAQEPSRSCQSCAAIVPDRRKVVNGLIKINYERIDLYPDFPELKASAKAGCGLCRLIRKTIRAKWATRPMEEWGVGPLREKEGLWDELLKAPWDRKVKIHNLSFSFKKISNASPAPSDTRATTEQDDYQGMVVFFGLDFGPATLLTSSDGTALYGEIGQVLGFKVYDSQGAPAFSCDQGTLMISMKISIQPTRGVNEGFQAYQRYPEQISSSYPTGLVTANLSIPSAVLMRHSGRLLVCFISVEQKTLI
jgi:hypothetical protein